MGAGSLKKLLGRPDLLDWFRLAALLGCTVPEAQQRVDSRWFSLWQAFWKVEPVGAADAERRAALAGLLAAGSKSATKYFHKPPAAVFGPVRRQSPTEMKRAMRRW